MKSFTNSIVVLFVLLASNSLTFAGGNKNETPPQTFKQFNKLPDLVVHEIGQFLPLQDHSAMRKVSRKTKAQMDQSKKFDARAIKSGQDANPIYKFKDEIIAENFDDMGVDEITDLGFMRPDLLRHLTSLKIKKSYQDLSQNDRLINHLIWSYLYVETQNEIERLYKNKIQHINGIVAGSPWGERGLNDDDKNIIVQILTRFPIGLNEGSKTYLNKIIKDKIQIKACCAIGSMLNEDGYTAIDNYITQNSAASDEINRSEKLYKSISAIIHYWTVKEFLKTHREFNQNINNDDTFIENFTQEVNAAIDKNFIWPSNVQYQSNEIIEAILGNNQEELGSALKATLKHLEMYFGHKLIK